MEKKTIKLESGITITFTPLTTEGTRMEFVKSGFLSGGKMFETFDEAMNERREMMKLNKTIDSEKDVVNKLNMVLKTFKEWRQQ